MERETGIEPATNGLEAEKRIPTPPRRATSLRLPPGRVERPAPCAFATAMS